MSEQRPGEGFDRQVPESTGGYDNHYLDAPTSGPGHPDDTSGPGHPDDTSVTQQLGDVQSQPYEHTKVDQAYQADQGYWANQSFSAPTYDTPTYDTPTYSTQTYGTPGYSAHDRAAAPPQASWTPPTWTPPPAGTQASTQTSPVAGAQSRTRRGIGVATLVGVAAMAATLGGGTGFALNRYLEPTTVAASSPATSTTAAPAATVTQVVQGNSSAPDWKVTAEAIKGSVVSIIVTDGQSGGQGSGVVLDTKGNIVTNNHVVADVANGAQVTVIIGDNTYDATLVGTDPSTDLAVLKLVNPPSDLKPMAFADSSAVAVGDPVMAFGNPLGLADTATTGIVSAVNRPVTTTASGTQNQSTGTDTVVTSAIQTSAAINPGNSGGALVNANGELIGITSSGATLTNSALTQSGSIGLGFAIPSNLVKTITTQLIASGTAKHAFVGISTNDATARLNGETVMGASVESVSAGTPAATSGLQKGDVITAMDGISVASSESLVGLIRTMQPGEVVEFTIIRGGEEIKKQVTLGSR